MEKEAKQEVRVYVDGEHLKVDVEGISEIGAVRMLQAAISFIIEGKAIVEEVPNEEAN